MAFFNNKKPAERAQSIILDTCALIDGRIIEIARTGFVPELIVVPQFVIAELQYLADHGDTQKRERARYGLDVIRELQDLRRCTVQIAREKFSDIHEVDDKLIALAKKNGGMLYTTDYNLNKVAAIEGVIVLNVNELAQALRPPRLPGERLTIKITAQGQDRTQGVGYLEDGTMVVVEQAGRRIGDKVQVEFSRMLQTQAGKMMFATLVKQPQSARVQRIVEQKSQPAPRPQRTEQPREPQPAPAPQPVQYQQDQQPFKRPGQQPQSEQSNKPAPRRRHYNRRRSNTSETPRA